MKITSLIAAACILACCTLPAVSQAEIKTGVLTLSPMLGGITMEGDQPVDSSGLAYSLGLGYNFTPNFGLEAVLGGANLDKKGSGDADFWNYRLDALYHFMPENRLVPYLAAGAGGYSLDSDEEFMANYGAGLLYFLGENVALRADVRHMMGFNESNLEHNLIYTAGFKFQFAGTQAPVKKEEPVAAAPVDSDGDGVTDDLDQCPGTPKGAPVDAKGCPLDSDGDGVYDYLDQCPGTPEGAPVDAKGCPLDSDGDGVYDYLDQCPDTPKGMSVDEKGCELKLTLRINFDFDQAVIKPEYKGELDKAAAFVRANANVPYILLTGHTDSKGKDAYNQRLSERRAEAVRQALINNYGLDPAKLKSRGYGETRPVASNDTEEGRYMNRRVELVCCTVVPE
ncbi:MAG: OmpA family protein [Syntrophotalea sp.]|jgi:OOP family OmpA-OmpF porin|uniref:OmpA family protein n=1 Tax=Syntrophotalea sp. TaxID=2812029 RepID=UPI003D09C26E